MAEDQLASRKYVSNLPPDATLKALVAAINARWICEQPHRQLKEELGLDHFEGRSWTGLHRHALMTMIAYTFLQSRRRLKAAGRKRKSRWTAASTEPAGYQAGRSGRSHVSPWSRPASIRTPASSGASIEDLPAARRAAAPPSPMTACASRTFPPMHRHPRRSDEQRPRGSWRPKGRLAWFVTLAPDEVADASTLVHSTSRRSSTRCRSSHARVVGRTPLRRRFVNGRTADSTTAHQEIA